MRQVYLCPWSCTVCTEKHRRHCCSSATQRVDTEGWDGFPLCNTTADACCCELTFRLGSCVSWSCGCRLTTSLRRTRCSAQQWVWLQARGSCIMSRGFQACSHRAYRRNFFRAYIPTRADFFGGRDLRSVISFGSDIRLKQERERIFEMYARGRYPRGMESHSGMTRRLCNLPPTTTRSVALWNSGSRTRASFR